MTVAEDDERATTRKIVDAYFPLVLEKRWDEWIELWDDEGVLDFPYAPAGRRGTYTGKKDILAYISALPGKIKIHAFKYFNIYPMLDPRMAVLEFAIDGELTTTGRPYNQIGVIFFETRGGKLWRYREYWNPLVTIDAHGGRDIWVAGFGSPADGEA